MLPQLSPKPCQVQTRPLPRDRGSAASPDTAGWVKLLAHRSRAWRRASLACGQQPAARTTSRSRHWVLGGPTPAAIRCNTHASSAPAHEISLTSYPRASPSKPSLLQSWIFACFLGLRQAEQPRLATIHSAVHFLAAPDSAIVSLHLPRLPICT